MDDRRAKFKLWQNVPLGHHEGSSFQLKYSHKDRLQDCSLFYFYDEAKPGDRMFVT